MKPIYIWWCNECLMEVDPKEHYNKFPRHSYTQRIRFSGVQIPPVGNDLIELLDPMFTTSTEFKTALRMNKGEGLMPGQYRLDWYCEIYQDNVDELTESRIFDGHKDLMHVDTANIEDIWVQVSGFTYINLNSNRVFELQWRSTGDGASAGIRNARLEFRRVK